MSRGNWKNRYGRDTFDEKGNLVEKGDVALLTPAQRRRVRKKERRAVSLLAAPKKRFGRKGRPRRR
jgi:hypothetical protein